MIASLASGSSVKVLLRVTDAKYGLLPFFFFFYLLALSIG